MFLVRKVAAKEKLPEKVAQVQQTKAALAYQAKMLKKIEEYVHDLHTTRLLRENALIPAVYCDGEAVKQKEKFTLPMDQLCHSKLGCGARHCRARPRGSAGAAVKVPKVQFVLAD